MPPTLLTTDDIEHNYPILLLSYITNNNNYYYNNNRSNNDVLKTIQTLNSYNKRIKRNIVEDDYEEETNKVWDGEQTMKIQLKKLKRLRNTCRRKPLYINFADIDYDVWIVQPTGYEVVIIIITNNVIILIILDYI